MVTCSILQLWLNAASVRSEKFDSQERSGCAYNFLEPTSQQNMFDCHGDFNVTAAKTRSYAADFLASSIVSDIHGFISDLSSSYCKNCQDETEEKNNLIAL